MTKKYAICLSGLFCAFLFGVMALHLALPDRERSETENRTLQQFPAFTAAAVADGTFMEDTEDYLADQFPGRDGWTGMKARVEQLLGKTEFRGVYLCGDTLINRGDEPGALAEKNLSYVSALAEKTGIPVYLGLIPTASAPPVNAPCHGPRGMLGSAPDRTDFAALRPSFMRVRCGPLCCA